MRERERVKIEERLYEAAFTGNIPSLLELIQGDRLILHRVMVGDFNRSPLYIAISEGHTDFVRELLHHNKELVEELDSQQRSLLHVASAKGRLVRLLVELCPEMCLARDRDGANPLHVAAIKGNVEVLTELVQVSPLAARVGMDKGETILHLCVKHNQLKTLELLLDKIKGPEFVNSKDDAGNTLLHLAVADKRFEIIKHVLKNSEIEVNATNASQHTAMDIVFLARSPKTKPEQLDCTIEDFLREAKAKRAKDLLNVNWLMEKRSTLMIVASLIATMAFQAGVNPPGGVWLDNSNAHRAGEAVMAYNYPSLYIFFLYSNTIGFVVSLSIILVLISDLPYKIIMTMWSTITFMVITYVLSIIVITPKQDRKWMSEIIMVALSVWYNALAILLLVHTGRLKLERIFRFAYGRIQRKHPQPSPNPV